MFFSSYQLSQLYFNMLTPTFLYCSWAGLTRMQHWKYTESYVNAHVHRNLHTQTLSSSDKALQRCRKPCLIKWMHSTVVYVCYVKAKCKYICRHVCMQTPSDANEYAYVKLGMKGIYNVKCTFSKIAAYASFWRSLLMKSAKVPIVLKISCGQTDVEQCI